MCDKISQTTKTELELELRTVSINSGFGSNSGISCDGAAKPELTDSCTVPSRASTLFVSHAKFCRMCRYTL